MIEIVYTNELDKWNRILDEFNNKDIYYSNHYAFSSIQSPMDKIILVYYYDNKFKAIKIIKIRDIYYVDAMDKFIKQNEYFDSITPYGYGGFIYNSNPTIEQIKKLDVEYEKFCREKKIIAEFTRFHPVINNAKLNNKELCNVQYSGKTVSIDLISDEYIWDNLTSKNRNMIRKAIKQGVVIKNSLSENIQETFIDMYLETMKKNNAADFYHFSNKYLKSMIEILEPNLKIFYAELNNEIIAMSMILFFDDKLTYHLSSSSKLGYKTAAMNLLLYEVSKWGVSNNFKFFHLGGGLGGKEDSLYKFKKSFNKNNDLSYYIKKNVINKEAYKKICEIKNIDTKTNKILLAYRD